MIYCLLLCDVLWALNIIVTKQCVDFFDPLFLVFIKLLFAAFVSRIYIWKKGLNLHLPYKKSLFINTQWINVLNFLFTYYSMTYVSGQDVSIINCLAPFIMNLFHCRIDLKSYGLCLFGLFIFIEGYSWGYVLLLAALVSYNYGHYRMKKYNQPIVENYYMVLYGAIEIGLLLLLTNNWIKEMNWGLLLIYIVLSSVGYVIIQVATLKAMRTLGLVKASFYLSFQPVMTYLFSIIFLNEIFEIKKAIGFCIVFASSYCLLKFRQRNACNDKTNT